MASKWRDRNSSDVQAFLDSVSPSAPSVPSAPTGQAAPIAPAAPPINIAKAQTLARSSGNPQAQRVGQGMLQEAAQQQERAGANAQRQAGIDARRMQREAEQAAADQAKAVEAARARDVRVGAAKGIKTETDIETGKRSLATHPDGGYKYDAGPIKDAPLVPETTSNVPRNPMISDDGGAASATGGTTQTTMLQPVMNDRGKESLVTPATTTDAKTGVQTISAVDPSTGQSAKTAVGIDAQVRDQARKTAEFKQREQDISLRANMVAQARAQFTPRWEPVKREFDDAADAVNKIPPTFRLNTATGKMEKIDPRTDSAVPFVDRELTVWQKNKKAAEERLAAAKTKHDAMSPAEENMNRNEKQIAADKLKLTEDRIRLESGATEGEGGWAKVLARQEAGEKVTVEEADALLLEELGLDPNEHLKVTVTRTVGGTTTTEEMLKKDYLAAKENNGGEGARAVDAGSMAAPEMVGPPKPLIPTDAIKAQVLVDSFQGLANPDQFKVGATGDGYAFIQRGDRGNVGFIEQDKATGKPLIVLGNNANADADIRQLVAFGGVGGNPVYMRDAGARDTVAEAQYLRDVYAAVNAPSPLNLDQGAVAKILADMGATTQDIARKVRAGEMSVQNGETIMRELYGTTLKASDPLAPATLGKWLEDAEPETKQRWAKINAEKDTEGRNGMVKEFINDWFIENRWKPGVNFQSRQLAEKSMISDKRTGEKAAALGGTLLEAGGSMIGMLSAPVMITVLTGGAWQETLTDSADQSSSEALLATMDNYGRGSKNTWRGWEANRKKWLTAEGGAKFKDYQDSIAALRAQITTQDVYPEGLNDPKFRADYKSRVDAVLDSAMAVHATGLESGWEVTREDLEQLTWMANSYALSGDASLMDSFASSLMEDHGTRQAQDYTAELTQGRGKFMSGLIAGAHAPPEEIGVEMLSTALTVGVGKVVFGGAKAAAAGTSVAASAGRMARFRAFNLGLKEDVLKLGMITDNLAKPASKLGKASNMGVKATKVGAVNSLTEAGEEAAMGMADRNATMSSVAGDAGVGALAGFFMGPVMGAPLALKAASRRNYDTNQAAAKFANAYNQAARGSEGFVALTPEQAKVAMAMVPPQVRDALLAQQSEASGKLLQATAQMAAISAGDTTTSAAQLDQAISAAQAEFQQAKASGSMEAQFDAQAKVVAANKAKQRFTANPEGFAADAFARAQAGVLKANDLLSTEAAMRSEAVQAIQALPAEEQDFGSAVAKVASGRADLLTSSERKAAGGAVTASGKPFFASVQGRDVVTDAGRADAKVRFPQIGALIQTTESQAIFDAAITQTPTNEQNPQEQAPAVGGDVSQNAGNSNTSGQRVAGSNMSELEANDYLAFQASGQAGFEASIGDVVLDAALAGRPFSASMADAAGFVPGPAGYTRQGKMWLPPAQVAPTPTAVASPARVLADRIKSAVEKAHPKLAGRIRIVETDDFVGGGAYVQSDGVINISVPDIQRALRKPTATEAIVAAYVQQTVVRHEAVHVVQFGVVRELWEQSGSQEDFNDYFRAWYGELAPGLLTAKAEKAAARIYGKEAWARLPNPGIKAAEFVRMLVEAKLDPAKAGEFSELFRSIELHGPKSPLAKLIAAAVKILKGMKLTGEAQQHIDSLVELYNELIAPVEDAAATPEAAVQADAKPNSSEETPNVDATDFVNTPGSENAPPQAEADTPTAIFTTGQALVAALQRHPLLKSDPKLSEELFDLTAELAEVVEGMESTDRRAFLDAAIDEWVNGIEALKEARAKEKEAAKNAARHARVKEMRAAAKSRLRDKARAILNSDVHEVLSAIFEKGSITPKPNAVGLILNRQKNGAKLTEKEMGIIRNVSDFNGMPRKQDYPGGGNNAVIREILDMLYARQGDGQMPNVMADKLIPNMTTASEMFEQMDTELRAISRGKKDVAGYNPMDDPNYEPTDAEIAAWEAQQIANEVKQNTQPYATMDDAHGFAIDAFGPESAIAQKIGAIAELSDRFSRYDMPDVRAGVAAEFARHAQGKSIPEWDAENAPLEGAAATAQKVLRAHTPESLRAALEALPVVDTGSALFSSPSPEAVATDFRKDLEKARNGQLPQNRTLQLGVASQPLALAGIPQGPVYMRQEVALSKPHQENHPYPPALLDMLPEMLQDPILIHESWTEKDSFVALLDAKDRGENLVAALHFRKTKNGIEITQVASVYPRQNHKILQAFKRTAAGAEGKITYYHKEKTRDWLNQNSGSNSPQYWIGHLGRGKNLSTNADIVNEAEEGPRLMSSPAPGEFSFNQTTDAGNKSQKGLNFDAPAATPAAAPASPGRTRPKTLIEFAKPYRGPSGASLVAYEWKHELKETIDKRGEDSAVRVSNWNEAATNWQTGREIVHQFHVTSRNGETRVTSLETALKLLGYTSENGVAARPVRSMASTLRNRSLLAMEAEALRPVVEEGNAAAARYEKEKAALERERMPKPMFTLDGTTPIMRIGPLEKFGQLAGTPESFAKRSEYDLRALENEWRAEEAAKRAGGKGNYQAASKLRELEDRIAKLDRKIQEQSALGSENQAGDNLSPSSPDLFSTIATLPPGPMAKFVENTTKAFTAAPEGSTARENIAKAAAKREDMPHHGKVQKMPQGMMDFGMSGSFGTKDQPGLNFGDNGRPAIKTTDGKTLEAPGPVLLFSSPAYHGTPHKVDKFSTDKIGTGEGAQAYGWGLYFADSREVAAGYRDALSGVRLLDATGKALWEVTDNPAAIKILKEAQSFWKKGKTTVPSIIQDIKSRREQAEFWAKDGTNVESNRAFVIGADEAIRLLQGGAVAKVDGNLYRVMLKVDDEDLLDWDKPLSEQSEKVKGSLGEIGIRSDRKGHKIYEEVQRQVFKDKYGERPDAYEDVNRFGLDKEASGKLLAAGIRGIRYLDGNSRSKSEGSYNYVIFDASDIEITEENGTPVQPAVLFSSPAPAQDTEYFAAVDAGDMATAQRLVDAAAKRAGLQGPWLHGSDADKMGGEFRVGERDSGWFGVGAYLTNFENYAKRWGKNVHRFYAPNGKYAEATIVGNYERVDFDSATEKANRDAGGNDRWIEDENGYSKDFASSMLKQGYIGARIAFGSNKDVEVVVFDPSQIKSAEPVTYDENGNVIPLSQRFNPASDSILFSSPAMGGQGAFDFGTTGSFNTRNQPGFDFSGTVDAPANEAAPIEPGTPDFNLLPREDKKAIVIAKTKAKSAEKAGISDFGEKLGGARKDSSIKTGESARPKKKNDKPGWFNRYEVNEVVAESKPSSPLESYLSRSSGMPTGDVGRFVINDKRKTDWRGNPERATRQSFATREEAEAFIPMIEVSRNHRVRKGEDSTYGIWRTVSDRKRVQVVKQTFDTEKEAMEFMAKHAADIIETKTSWREELIVKPENAVRSGPERRKGPATAEMFQEAFGFRGVEFGNWMRQAGDGKERQEVLNHAYDGLIDLAELLGIPPMAISLNGELGLAFGARGQGLSGAKAHYEPDYVVINLTKMSGAGSLAHEWIHALDHYLGRQDGRASSQLVKNKDGDMVLNPGAFEENAVSTRFSRESKVRDEVKNAFVQLMDTIMTKSVEYVEDSNKAENFVSASRKALEDNLQRLRKEYTRDPDPRWEKRRKPATEAQRALFESIADRLMNGQDLVTDWRGIDSNARGGKTYRWTNDTLEQLGALHKQITNRSGFDTERKGWLDDLRGYMERYRQRIAMLESAAASETKVKKVPTDFAMNAKRIDQGSASDYWNVPHEMLARGFSAYVEDRIADTGGTSDFLSYGSDNSLAKYRMFNVKPFPEGPEREAINEKFDKLFGVIETKETDKGVALFSSPTSVQHSYASGIDKPRDVLGALRANVPVGTTAQALATSKPLRNIFRQALQSGRPVFVDSGAFSAFTRGNKIDFDKVFDTYDDLASAGSRSLTVVGPDVLGDQQQSARLVKQYAPRVRSLIDAGARVILPVQAGEMDIAEFLSEAGFSPSEVAVGIPSNKAGYPRRQLRDHLKGAGVTDVHFLGMSDQNREAAMMVKAARESGARTITLDANRIRSRAGREIVMEGDTETRRDLNTDLIQESIADLTDAQRKAIIIESGLIDPEAIDQEDLGDQLMNVESMQPGFIKDWLMNNADLPQIENAILRERAVSDALFKDARNPLREESPSLFSSPSPGRITKVSKPSKKDNHLRVGTARLGTDAKPLPTPVESNIGGEIVPPDVLAKQMADINYDHLPANIREEIDPIIKREKFISWVKANLLALYDAFPKEVRDRATHWYDGANKIAKDFGNRFQTTAHQAAGVIAVLSPQKDWFMNVAQGEQVMDIWANHQDTEITAGIVLAQMDEIIEAAQAPAKQKKKAKTGETKLARTRRRNYNKRLDEQAKADRRAILLQTIGKSVRELDSEPYLQGWAIRLLAQSIHGREYRVISPEGDGMEIATKKDGQPQKNGWGSINEIEKAVRILKDGSMENISNNLSNEHKVRNFYNNIIAPNNLFGDATIDTHAVAAGHLMPMGSSSIAVKHNFGTLIAGSGALGISGVYHLYLDAYKQAAAERGIMPRQMQSITWEAIRQLYPAESRRDKNVIAASKQTWQNHPHEQARKLLLGRGISSPTWARTSHDGKPAGVSKVPRKTGNGPQSGGGLLFGGGTDGRGGINGRGGISASLASSPTPQPDLFTATNAPDATEKLGKVKVGTMSALGAYRALTAKRNAGKALSDKEEDQLLNAEKALGQKLAFDMESVKGEAPTVNDPLTVQPTARFGQNRRDAQDEMSRAGEIDRSGQISLLSSPTQDAAVQIALEAMPPIYRQVFEAVNAGSTPEQVMDKFKISENAVTSILNQVRSRITAATAAADGPLTPNIRDGLLDGGRPDLALSTNPQIAAIDQIRNESEVPDVRAWDEVNAQAAAMLENNYQGTYDALLAKARDLQPMTDIEVSASKMIIAKETLAGKIHTFEDRVKLAMMIHGYRDIGTETARALAIRRDPHKSPAERHAMFIAEALFTPDAETRKALRGAKKGQQESILAGWMARVDAIKADMLAQGVDIDASLAAFNEAQQARKQAADESPRVQAAVEEAIRKLSPLEKMVIEAIRNGALLDKIQMLTGLDAETILDINARFNAKIRESMVAAAKRFLAGSLASSPVDMMTQILAELGVWGNDVIDNRKADFVDRRKEILNPKPRKQKPATPKKVAPQLPGLTPEQQAAIDAAFERFQNTAPAQWKTFWQTEMATLAPMIGQTSFEQFKGEAIQPWRDLWQTEMDGIATPAARISFEDWAAKPATAETVKRERDMFAPPVSTTTGERSTDPRDQGRLLPTRPDLVSTTTGTFDLNDPLAVKAVLDAFSVARGGKMDALMEFWKMSILTGPQTHLVNTSSNLLNSAYNLLPRRAVEATINNILGVAGQGSDKAATFGEFVPMAQNLRKGLHLAARNMLRSWKMETRTFEAYARAEALQLDFTGVGNEYIPPALSGKIGKIMRSLSFRAMTAADEFQKSLYGQMEAAAQAHRIAKIEEKLSGDAYAARINELMETGSVAWIRAIDEAKRITFQQNVDGTNPQIIRRLDQLAELAKTGRNMPWIGRPLTFFLPFIDTPLNIFKEAVEVTPIGGFLAVVDGIRSLRRRVFAGKLTPEAAKAEAELIYNRARLVRDMTNQTIGLGLFFAIQGMLKTDDGDDDDLPMITGTVPYKTTRRGERDNASAVMPAQSLRIGGVQFSYQRFEPFATVLASTVDLVQAMNRNGGFKPAVASEWLNGFKNQVKDKTFLQGISNLINALEDPDRFAERISAGIVTGFVPNIIRQPLREADQMLRDAGPRADEGFLTAISKRVGYSLVPQSAPAKQDVWGNDIRTNRGETVGNRATDLALRIFDPTNLTVNPDIDPIDAWIFRWNLSTADSKERIAIEPISNSVSGKVPGEKRARTFPLTQQEQAEANREAGRQARESLGEGWDEQPLDAETAQRIIDTVRRSQEIHRGMLRMRKLSEATVTE